MYRPIVVSLTLAMLAPTALADVLVVQKGKRFDFIGIPSKVSTPNGDVEITPENAEVYAPEHSTGLILREGYDGIEISKTGKGSKGDFYPESQVVKIIYTTRTENLLDGHDQMALGAYAQAIGSFRAVIDNPEARDVFKNEASYWMGIAYAQSGRLKDCLAHFRGWKTSTSVYTPEVFRLVADLYTQQRQYGEARESLNRIGTLENITENWKYKARLGEVKVDIAERKYGQAEHTAMTISREVRGKEELNGAAALAATLQAEAIRLSGSTERFGEARGLLEAAARLERVDASTRALLYLTLGHVIYSQRNPDEARYAYMRCALMFPGNYEGDAFHNAGLCFLDLSGKAANEGKAEDADELLIKGMKLLGTAAGRYRHSEARKAYAQNKKSFEEAQARRGEATEQPDDKPEEG